MLALITNDFASREQSRYAFPFPRSRALGFVFSTQLYMAAIFCARVLGANPLGSLLFQLKHKNTGTLVQAAAPVRASCQRQSIPPSVRYDEPLKAFLVEASAPGVHFLPKTRGGSHGSWSSRRN